MRKMTDDLEYIMKEQKELSVFGGISALLGWDQLTYMPAGGAAERAEHGSLISRLSHEKVIDDTFYDAIQRLTKETTLKTLDEEHQHIILRLQQDVEKARKIPSSFVEKMSKTTTMAYQAWEQARVKNAFAVFAPHLEKILALEREYISYMDIPGPAYNTLLDDYEEGMTVEKLSPEFSQLERHLKRLIETITTSKAFEHQSSQKIIFSEDQQRKVCTKTTALLGLPKETARLDVSTHPFTTAIGTNDVRITTSFSRPNPLFSFFSTVHEAGHALYELGLPQGVYKDTVISDSPSLGMHESQSRFWENMIARNHGFWQYILPVFKEIAPNAMNDFTVDSWYKEVNKVQPSLIRVEADELTYCLHVILRFHLEQQLINEEIPVGSLPDHWTQYMEELLGVTPQDDVQGVLQDMHWSGGSFGYFPTYAIGSIYASQLFAQLGAENTQRDELIQTGQFSLILQWLREHIHQYGRRMTADQIMKKTCGEGLNAEIFLTYLKTKFLPLYS
jgi:carboxypeptidase Taq